MATRSRYNMRSPAVRRLMREAIELKDPSPLYHSQPLEENLFEWHFTIRGPPETDYEAGRYHGRIILPPEYPMKPPSIILTTPNGRFELHHKICLSASAYHPELWQASWGIRTMLLALIGFMATDGHGSIGSLECPGEERRRLAQRSLEWVCPVCGEACRSALLPDEERTTTENAVRDEVASIVSQMSIKTEQEVDALYKKQQQHQQHQQHHENSKPVTTIAPSHPEATTTSSDADDNNTATDGGRSIQTDSDKGCSSPGTPHSGGARQRGGVRTVQQPAAAATTAARRREQDRLCDRGTLVVIFLLVAAICILLARRFLVL